MRRYVLVLALSGAAVVIAGSLLADEPRKGEKKELTKKDVAEMMKATHKGDKTPHARTAAELQKETPDWDQLAKDAKAFTEMGKVLGGVNYFYYHEDDRYAKSATALSKATGEKDKKAANVAFTALTKSCVACHCYHDPLK
jgi:hypothetical protein